MKVSYFEKTLQKMVDDSKYNEKNISFFYDIEFQKMVKLGSISVEKIFLFGSKQDDYFDLCKMLILLDDRNVLWYDFQKNNGNINKSVLYASMLAHDKVTSIYQQFKAGNIVFIDKKHLAIAEALTSVFSFKVPEYFLDVLITQSFVSVPYLLKCKDVVLNASLANRVMSLDYILPASIFSAFAVLFLSSKSVCDKQKVMKQYFSKFEQNNSKIKKNLLVLFYSIFLGNLVFASVDNAEKFFGLFNKFEAMIDNPFSDIDVSDEIDDVWSYNQLENAILENYRLSDKDKEIYLKNLEAVFDDYDYNLEELYDVFSTVKTYDAECKVVSDNGRAIMLACYSHLDNVIYDFANSYNHDNTEILDLVRSHEIGHSFGSRGLYSWLNEGVNSLIQNEYFGYDTDFYDEYVVIAKYFCELFGTDVVLDSYFGSDKKAISNRIKRLDSCIDADEFLTGLDKFEFGSSESLDFINVMRYCAYCAYNLDDDSDMKLSDDGIECILGYLDYLSGETDSYRNKGYVSSQYIEKINKNPVLIKRR